MPPVTGIFGCFVPSYHPASPLVNLSPLGPMQGSLPTLLHRLHSAPRVRIRPGQNAGQVINGLAVRAFVNLT